MKSNVPWKAFIAMANSGVHGALAMTLGKRGRLLFSNRASGIRSMSVKHKAPAPRTPKPRERGTEARAPGRSLPGSQMQHPAFGKGGGGSSIFAPTRLLPKFKALPKRCRSIMQAIDAERVSEIHSSRPLQPFRPGDIVQVTQKTPEARRRLSFRGICIARRNRGLGSSFTLRNVNDATPVERTFQLYSPLIESLEVKGRRKVRRAKLYYLREKSNKFSKV